MEPEDFQWIALKVIHRPGENGTLTDRLVLDLVRPLVTVDLAGLADRYFFLRYLDEDGFHLRVRARFPRPAHDRKALVPAQRRLDCLGVVAELSPARYQPETEKYGGPVGIDVAERQFTASTDFAFEVVRVLDDGRAWRTMLAAQELSWLLNQLRLDPRERTRLMRAYGVYWARLAGVGASLPEVVAATLKPGGLLPTPSVLARPWACRGPPVGIERNCELRSMNWASSIGGPASRTMSWPSHLTTRTHSTTGLV
jgi:hypothetical protein